MEDGLLAAASPHGADGRLRQRAPDTKEAWGGSGTKSASSSNLDVSLTSIHSVADDPGYQASLELTSEEDAGLAQSKRQKRNKVVVFQMGRRKKRKEEHQDDTDDEDENSEGAPTSLQSPRMSQKPHLYSRTRPRRPREHVSVLESSLSEPTSKTQPCPWSLAWFCQYLCSCCHRRHKSVGGNEALDSIGRRALDERGMVPGSVCEQRSQWAPGETPRAGLGRSQNRARHCSACT
nr:PREDICTED: uncharacterized protein LOC109434300 [Rhinolophus sinicus]